MPVTPAKPDQTVFVVDDDPSVRDSLGLLLGLHGYRTAMFSSGEAFLAAARPTWRGCVLLDVRMNGATGLAVQASMRDQGIRLPVIIITAHGDVATTRAAFKAEAVDLLEKPIDNDVLIRTIDQALELDARNSSSAKQASEYAERIASLSQRERDVMFRIARGEHNRDVAEALGISPRTVEVHKARLMQKLEADNVPQLVRLVLQAGD